MLPGVRPSVHALLLLSLLVAPRAGAARDGQGQEAGVPSAPLRYRANTIVVRVTDGVMPTRSRALAGLESIAAAFAGATIEPEFSPELRAAPNLFAPSQPAFARAAAALDAFYLVHLPPGTDLDAALAAFRASPDVAAADPIAIMPVEAVPNDSLWWRAWHLYQPTRRDLHAPEAWELSRGDTAVVVGVIDTGVLLDHPDLHDQIWTNFGESGGVPGADDDGNGFIDDLHGWDFVALDSAGAVVPGEDWRDADNDPNDYTSHGTAVAGLIGASTDNAIGVAGVAWHVRIMALRVGYSDALFPSGVVDLALASQAIVYAARNGASVLNLSFLTALQADLAAAADFAIAAGVTIVAAAGNGPPLHYMARREDVIAVAATDSTDKVATWSSRGPNVAIAAPGVNLVTTLLTRPGTDSVGVRQPSYVVGASGTSFSTPLVVGAAALLQADRRAHGLPPMKPAEVRLRLAETADDISARNPGITGYGAGRLNVYRALSDPYRSFALHAGGLTLGPGLRLPTLAPPARGVFATNDAQLVFADLAPAGATRSAPLTGVPMGGVAAADLGGGRGIGVFVGTRAGKLEGFDGAGRPLPGWPVAIPARPWSQSAQPSLGDLDGDGVLEIVWGGDDGTVRAWHADGTAVPGFPRVLVSQVVDVRIALADLDGAPGVEIAATLSTGPVYALRGDGTDMPGWPVPGQPATVFSPTAPLIIRFDAEGHPGIAVAQGFLVNIYSPTGGTLLTRSASGYQFLPLAAADLFPGAGDELVLARTNPFQVIVMDFTGSVRAQIPVPEGFDPSPDGVSLVGSLGPGGTPAVLIYCADHVLRAYAFDGTPLAGYPKPGGAGAAPSIDHLGGDGESRIFAGSGRDSLLYFLAAGSGTWNPAAQFWPTEQGNYARTSSTFYAPPLSALDNVPPAPVTDLVASDPGTHGATLRWTTPADLGPAGQPQAYEVRWAAFPLDDSNFANAHPVADTPAPGAPGSPAVMQAAGLPENASIWLAVRCVDAAGNASAVSTPASVTTGASAPGVVRDLRVVAWTDTSVTLRWTATGDDGVSGRPSRYRLRGARSPLDAGNFDSAPLAVDVSAAGDAGASETAVLPRLAPGSRYWIALMAEDASGQVSAISNVISTVPGPLATAAGLALAPRSRPSGVPVELYWQGAPATGPREIRLYDVAGRLVRELPLGSGSEGIAPWDGLDRDGRAVHSGLYFAVLEVGGERTKSRVVLVQ
jgi:subtilisin family serine protease